MAAGRHMSSATDRRARRTFCGRLTARPACRCPRGASRTTPNQVTVEFQDAFNGYQQDSLLMVDVDDINVTGQVITTTLMALGIPNYDQAARISQFTLDKVDRREHLHHIRDQREGAGPAARRHHYGHLPQRRASSASHSGLPRSRRALNYRITTITAQIYKTTWYDGYKRPDTGRHRREPAAELGRRRAASAAREHDRFQAAIPEYQITESSSNTSDGGVAEELTVGFVVPPTIAAGGPAYRWSAWPLRSARAARWRVTRYCTTR